MTLSLPNPRYEKKFVAERANIADVLAAVRRHPSAFHEVYPPRVVNNVYLDSPARKDYHDHVNGAANRTKTRVRWYGQRFDEAPHPKLERKLKRGMISGKETYELLPLSINGGSVGARFETRLDTISLPPVLKSVLQHMEPALLNRYQRRYFLSRDGNYRLTLDFGLQFASVAHKHSSTVSFSRATQVVIELKFSPELAEEAASIGNALPYRLARFSKYVEGIECLGA